MSLKGKWQLLLLLPAGLLFWLAFRDIPLRGIRNWAEGFGIFNLMLLILYEIGAWILMGERWRFFCRENGVNINLGTATAARLAGFSWSYITPGPHLGGEPVQLYYLSRRGIPVRSTLPALVRDRAYEFFSGLFTSSFLVFLPGADGKSAWISGMAAFCFLALTLMPAMNHKVFRCYAGVLLRASGPHPPRRRRIYQFLKDLFQPFRELKRGHAVQGLLLLSVLLAPLLTIGEMALFFTGSGVQLNWRTVLVLAAVSRISHYAPVPGAVGVYDLGMIAASGWFGLDPIVAAAYILFTRLRDLIQVGTGLLLFHFPTGAAIES
jgi:uncharacterized protein (TIRG00374 family)